ncbi:hypothetical protein ACFT1A_01955 [Rhodococcus sp. NPDC057135]|uniref:hypothetical protein n=1 Tax=Rhodococcus sp. NPDC057135 TaxID=3346028 RepID=UPI0036456612
MTTSLPSAERSRNVRAPNFVMMDPPDHTRFHQIISSGFTPKAVKRLRDKIEV